MNRNILFASLLVAAGLALPVQAQEARHDMTQMMATGLMMPSMDAARGRELFASKGCVVCHSVNGIGGVDAPEFSAEFMDPVMNPFEFTARMWRGAGAMVMMQEAELGGQIDLTGQELADIIAFVHDPEEQRRFSAADIPAAIAEMMEHGHRDDGHDD
ncbi:MAG: c-type cytochrome [Roseivivax sp.]|nr:c-type cytochrome [Roseivivax sp.]